VAGFKAPTDSVRKACAYLKDKGYQVAVASREQLREWVGPENYDQTVSALESAATWIGEKASQAGTAIKDAAVVVKDKTVEAASAVGEAVSDGAARTWRKAQSGWSSLRRQFE
jgi:hypothetical protein